MKKLRLTDLLLFVIGTELVGVLSAILSGGSFGEYYDSLAKPPFYPSGAVFPVVWAVLYALMGVSAYLIYADCGEGKNKALGSYAFQLLANFLWSPVFFGLKQTEAAAVILLILIVLTVIMLIRFARIRRIAAFLNIPYLLWLIYAAYLNIGILIVS